MQWPHRPAGGLQHDRAHPNAPHRGRVELRWRGLMNVVFEALYWLHVPAALSCIPAFWAATLTKKGGRVHVLTGRWFAYGMIFVALS